MGASHLNTQITKLKHISSLFKLQIKISKILTVRVLNINKSTEKVNNKKWINTKSKVIIHNKGNTLQALILKVQKQPKWMQVLTIKRMLHLVKRVSSQKVNKKPRIIILSLRMKKIRSQMNTPSKGILLDLAFIRPITFHKVWIYSISNRSKQIISFNKIASKINSI